MERFDEETYEMNKANYERRKKEEEEKIKRFDRKTFEVLLTVFLSMVTAILTTLATIK